MKLLHRCRYRQLPVSDSVAQVEHRWRCPTCGAFWWVRQYGASSQLSRAPRWYPNVRGWLWARRMKKEM